MFWKIERWIDQHELKEFGRFPQEVSDFRTIVLYLVLGFLSNDWGSGFGALALKTKRRAFDERPKCSSFET